MSAFRPEIQGLRAVAVLLVVVFHLWPEWLSGGYVGVDVFFVISGYLITAHILREVEQTGHLDVRRFWARRIRRLLPASLLVLAVSALGVLAVAPSTVWGETSRQVAASAMYVQNWAMAFDAVDYMAADNAPTVAHHYWSLAVEEQFYLVWPLVVVGVVALARRASSRARSLRTALVASVGVLVTASFAWSVVSTMAQPSFAYLSTFTRLWELGAGALTALLLTRTVSSGRTALLLGWCGLVGVVAAAVLFDATTLFPGWVAMLPVLGAVAVIVAGAGGRGSAGRVLSLAPARFVGDISYSVYLWHWPLIVLVPYAAGRDLGNADKVAVLAATLLLAWVSKTHVEDRFRTGALLSAAPWRAFAFAAAGMVAAVVAAVAVMQEMERRERASLEAVEVATDDPARCVGPRALDAGSSCEPVTGEALLAPPEVVAQQNSDPPFPECQQTLADDELRRCELGDTHDPERVVALVGDSHATHWFSAFDELGRELGWKVVTMTKSSCPLTEARRVLATEQTDTAWLSCERWIESTREALLTDPAIEEVFVSTYSTAYEWESAPGDDLTNPGPDGFVRMWSDLLDAGKSVTVLAAVPRTNGENVPSCLAQNPGDVLACAVPRETALPGDVMVEAARRVDDEGLRVVDLSDRYCDETTCYPVVGGVIVYRDYSHLSAEYSTMLVPYVRERLEEG